MNTFGGSKIEHGDFQWRQEYLVLTIAMLPPLVSETKVTWHNPISLAVSSQIICKVLLDFLFFQLSHQVLQNISCFC